MEANEIVQDMADAITAKKTKGDILYRLSVYLLLGFILYAQLFVKSNYVSVEKYEKDRKEDAKRYDDDRKAMTELMSKMHDEILTLISADKVNDQQNKKLDDFETRVRVLESHDRYARPPGG